MMKEIKIKTEYITLVQLLKFADITSSGGEGRFFLEDHTVYYNGEVETRKRKKLYPGDVVTIDGIGSFKICI